MVEWHVLNVSRPKIGLVVLNAWYACPNCLSFGWVHFDEG